MTTSVVVAAISEARHIEAVGDLLTQSTKGAAHRHRRKNVRPCRRHTRPQHHHRNPNKASRRLAPGGGSGLRRADCGDPNKASLARLAPGGGREELNRKRRRRWLPAREPHASPESEIRRGTRRAAQRGRKIAGEETCPCLAWR